MTLYAPITSIRIAANRQRKEFPEAELVELGESIVKVGLLHAPVLRQLDDGTLQLVSGERRLRVMTDLHELGREFFYSAEQVPPGQIPYTTLGLMDPLDAWEAELEENIRRVDLTWQERAAATAELMQLRQAQAAEAGRPAPTMAQLTLEVRDVPKELAEAGTLGDYQTQTRNEVIVSRFLSDPDVAKAPSLKEAVKILKKKEERSKQNELAATIGRTFTAHSHQLLQEDFLQWQVTAESAQFDIILTDPPYGMGADEFGDSGQGVGAAAHFYEDSYENWLELMQVFPAATFALARQDAHAYVFCDIDRFPELRERMSAAGWKCFRTPLIWHNLDGFRAPWPKQGPQRKYECILFAVKGDRAVNSVKPDVLAYGKDPALGHPAQKPVPLLIDLLSRSARPGDRVFDPCAGSGATIEACHELKLTCTALEKIPAAYGIAVKRLQGLQELEKELL